MHICSISRCENLRSETSVYTNFFSSRANQTPIQSPQKSINLTSSPGKTPLTPEMRDKIERSKKKALEIKLQKQKEATQDQEDVRTPIQSTHRRTSEYPPLGSVELSSKNHVPSTPRQSTHLDRRSETVSALASPPSKNFSPDPRCTVEQLKAINLVKKGQNVFVTGATGVGKTFVLNEMVKVLKANNRRVSYTTTTEGAVLPTGCKKIHSWASIGLGQGSVETIYKRHPERHPKQHQNTPIGDTDVLIVDEISMLYPEIFDKISILCQAIRRKKGPFGGMQVILCGDFFKLPSAMKDKFFSCMYCGCPEFELVGSGAIKCIKPHHGRWIGPPCGRTRKKSVFCFETPTWYQLKLEVVQLTKVFRREDKLSLATKVRQGLINEDQIDPHYSIVKRFYASLNKQNLTDEWQKEFLDPQDFFSSPNSPKFTSDSQDEPEEASKGAEVNPSHINASTNFASPVISTSSIDDAQLISIADAAEQTFSQKQQSSQARNDKVKEEETRANNLDSKTVKKCPSSPEVEELDACEIIELDREDIKLKRKADSLSDDVKPQLKRSHLVQSTSSEKNDVKPFSANPPLASGSTKLLHGTKLLDRLNESSIEIDEKPEVKHQAEVVEIQTGPSASDSRPESADQILENFTRRICNSIYRLNKSLLDLPTNNRAFFNAFNSDNVRDHINLLVQECFHNPHLVNDTTNNARAGPSTSMFRSSNNLSNSLFESNDRLGDWRADHDYEDEYSADRNSYSMDEDLYEYDGFF